MSMKRVFLMLGLLSAMTVCGQEIEAVDSIDLRTGVIRQAKGSAVDTIHTDSIDCAKPPIPQIPFSKLDSLTIRQFDDRYCVVWKDGKCGVYDLLKEKNVTRIEYTSLRYAFRKRIEKEYYTYFAWEEEETLGIVSIAEANNQFMTIAMPKKEKDEDGKETLK